MAQITGAKSSYSEPIATGGNREDLSDVLFDVSPTETPFITSAKKGKATGVAHDWLTDALDDPATNAHVEGEVAAPTAPGDRVRLSNYTQILNKHAVVTGTQETVLKGGGIKSEMAYQVARRMKEIKRDAELAMIGSATAKVAGSDSVARKMGSFVTYMTSASYLPGATGSAPTGNSADTGTPGTARAFTEDILKGALQTLWTNSGGNENILAITGSKQRGVFSNFTASSTRYVTFDDKRLNASIDVYDGDFHTVTVQANRYATAGAVALVDPEYVKVCDLRPISAKDLAVTGDGKAKEIIWETTLEVCNPKAHMYIAALTTA